jgi:hypothetical protein
VCPAAPTAASCARNSFVQRFLALVTNPSLGFFSSALMNFSMPSPDSAPDLSMCGDPDAYRCNCNKLYWNLLLISRRQTVLINGMGGCLRVIVDAFPLPTPLNSATLPGSSVKLADMMKKGMLCALTSPSYRYQTYCSGNVGKCFSLRTTPELSACKDATGSFCPATCRDQLVEIGNTSSTRFGLGAKCCVRWFQQEAAAAACSVPSSASGPPQPGAAPTGGVSISALMGPACVGFMKTNMAAAMASQTPGKEVSPGAPPPPPGKDGGGSIMMSPEMMNALFDMPMLPAPCSARSPFALAVQHCNAPTTGVILILDSARSESLIDHAGLEAACAADNTPFVLASLFAPRKTSTVKITFASSSLKAVRVPHLSAQFTSCPLHTAYEAAYTLPRFCFINFAHRC